MLSLQRIFENGGTLAKSIPNYEMRLGQYEMASHIQESIHNKEHIIIEAGCGIGKTFAYLIPVARLYSQQTVISTGTRALQEQLYYKDIPVIKEHIRKGLNVVYIKGRSNYLCLQRLSLFRQCSLFDDDATENLLNSIYQWSHHTITGDVSELAQISEYSRIWKDVCCTTDTCLNYQCSYYNDGCVLMKLKREAKKAEIVIVNHHLFFADLMAKKDGHGVLPDYHILVFDEAHMLESIATQFLGKTFGSRDLYYLEKEIQQQILEKNIFSMIHESVISLLDLLNYQTRIWFEIFDQHYGKHRLSIYDQTYIHQIPVISEILQRLKDKLSTHSFAKTLTSICSKIQSLIDVLRLLEEPMVENYVYWIDSSKRSKTLSVSPIHVAELFQEYVFSQKKTVILTSATLSSNNNFEYINSRLGIVPHQTHIIKSPFDYTKQAQLYVPKDLPLPNAKSYLPKLAEFMLNLIRQVKGRTFCLFTSYTNMKYVYEHIRIAKLAYPLLCQGNGNRSELLKDFIRKSPAVLFATNTFWQGIDVQGEALSCVIIDKLPFSVPTDPIAQARMKKIEADGGDSFYDYQIPNAVILIRQGIGRLIRSATDTGVIAICDKRLVTRSYGKQFLDSFPDFTKIYSFQDIAIPIL